MNWIPAGSGNDWIKSLGFKNATVASCVAAMAKGVTKLVDTGLCVWSDGRRFFLNSAGVGFDALILRRTVSSRRFLPLGGMNYLLTLAVSAVVPPRWKATVFCDGEVVDPGKKAQYIELISKPDDLEVIVPASE